MDKELAPARTRHDRRRTLIGLLFLATAGGLSVYSVFLRPTYSGASLDVAEAHRQARDGSVLLIDIRRPDEWERTGIPDGAHAIDMRRPDFSGALLAAAGHDRARAIALICARGVRSAKLGERLTAAGFENVLNVPEGMLGSSAGPGWLALGLPVQHHAGHSE
ncbi:rhodanese-like domain-containing protein [Sedimentitalea xiamensis]|nr:rhodanese-like domain-containing protein [Sedimentitalea xiamensis]